LLLAEIWAGPSLRRLNFGLLRPLAARFHPDLKLASVKAWNVLAVQRFCVSAFRNGVSAFERFVHEGKWLSEKGRDYLVRQKLDLRNTIVFSYDTTALELFQWAREQGAMCILGQMDPSRVEFEMVRKEEARWPDFSISQPSSLVPRPSSQEAYFRRREQEWALADRIIVNSEWCRKALLEQGVPADKVVIIPLSFEEEETGDGRLEIGDRRREMGDGRWETGGTLRVLFLGQVILRKGIQYLVEAARMLERENVRFDVVGPIGICEQAVKSAPANMTFHGRVSRDQARDWYRQSDVFVLPTVSDGFALTQLEAMAYGLPVIATPNCGEVVRDGIDGLIVPARDASALAKAIQRFAGERKFLGKCSSRALERVKDFSLEKLSRELLALGESRK
jgi:glycosyltransferase involved in cell wall biosynthesis